MAVYTAGAFPVTMDRYDEDSLKFWVLEAATESPNTSGWTVTSRSATQVVIQGPGGEILTFTGTGFATTGALSADTDYTVTGFSESAGGSVFTLTGISVTDDGIDTTPNGNAFTDAFNGNDTITGSAGNDFLYGGNGNDTVNGGLGADRMGGGYGNDIIIVDNAQDYADGDDGTDTVQSSVSFDLGPQAESVENVTLTGAANINATGDGNNNVLTGNTGTNILNGGGGNDTYVVQSTADVVIETGGGSDTVVSSVSWVLDSNNQLEHLTITGTAANATGNSNSNNIQGNALANVLDGKGSSDSMAGGLGNDTYIFDQAGDVANETSDGGGTDLISATSGFSGSLTLANRVENFTYTGSNTVQIYGNALNNTIITGSGESGDLLKGRGGNDDLRGGGGNDFYIAGVGDTLTEAANAGYDNIAYHYGSLVLPANFEMASLYSDAGNANLTGNALDNDLTGNQYNNTLDGGTGADDMTDNSGGNDVFIVDNEDDSVEDNGGGTDRVQSSIDFSLWDVNGSVENLTLTGTTALYGGGNNSDNVIIGNALANTLYGGGGYDTLDGGAGADVLVGGAKGDIYILDNTGDVVIEEFDSGPGDYDEIRASFSYVLNDPDIEHLTLLGSAAINATGNAYGNNIVGNAGANVIDGLGGGDNMNGYGGNDTYFVDNSSDNVYEDGGSGTDIVFSTVSFTLNDGVDNLTLTGTGNNNAYGNDLVNVLTGNVGNNNIVGYGGNDTMIGGLGNDVYNVGQTGDVVTELANEGVDTLYGSEISLSLAALANVENITLYGGNNINATGNAGDNVLLGNIGNNRLDGGAGVDVMDGDAGDDVIVVDNIDDVVNGGSNYDDGDRVESSVDFGLEDTNAENLTLTGTAFLAQGDGNNNILIGNSAANLLEGLGGDDTLDGGLGADEMRGGSGSDFYRVDNTGDTVNENPSDTGSIDTVSSSVSFTLGHAVENLILTGTTAITATGNSDNNNLVGNSANNTLDGQGGDDYMEGGLGNDVYFVNSQNDFVVEEMGGAPGGVDEVQSSVTFDLVVDTGGFVENLTLTGGQAIDGRGNDLNNTISVVGGNASNGLDGGQGADTMSGGDGSDSYVVDHAGDVVNEVSTSGGTADRVLSFINYTLTANVEQGMLANYGGLVGPSFTNNLNLTGNALDNSLVGNIANNVLDGGTGADYMAGGRGNDVYIVDNIGDFATEAQEGGAPFGGGVDEVRSSVAYTLTDEDIENLTLTGTVAINGTGNSLNNILTGNSGVNALTGGDGDDTYRVQNTTDTVVESTFGGIDTVESSVSFSLLTNGANVENLTLTGNAVSATGTGNLTVGNILTGNSVNNTLDGGAGFDTMIGGLGNDLYIVDNTGDMVNEFTRSGTDTVSSSADYTLNANVENLTLTGTAVSGTGNNLNNVITGTTGDNTLSGGTGADRMIGGDGSDTYIVDNAFDRAVETSATSAGGTDLVQSSVSFTLGANVENLALTGGGNTSARGNALINTLTGNNGDNVMNGGGGGEVDTMNGGNGNDIYIVDNSTDVAAEASGSGFDTVRSSVTYTLDATNTIEDLALTGTAVINGTGNTLNNTLTGNSVVNNLSGGEGDDFLDGRGGADTMTGGDGNDTYIVNNVGDVVVDVAADTFSGFDTVLSSVTFTIGDFTEQLVLTGNSNISGIAAGGSVSQTISGNDGNNLLDGGAGNDILNGNDGDDVFIWDANAINDNIDGGDDFDTLRMVGATALDLDGYGGGTATIDDIDAVDANNGVANTIFVYGGDILDMSDTGVMTITGDSLLGLDTVEINGGANSWNFDGQQMLNGIIYNVYSDGFSGASLLISENVDVNLNGLA